MRTTKLFAVAATALILAGIAGWASSTGTKAAAPTSVQIDPFQVMMNSKNLPASHYDDYSLVFI
jgi:hypothetical protein